MANKIHYLLDLIGSETHVIKVVDQETWDWIRAVAEDGDAIPVPESIQKAWKLWQPQDEPLGETFEDDTEDRARLAPPAVLGGKRLEFFDLLEFVKFVREHPRLKFVESHAGILEE